MTCRKFGQVFFLPAIFLFIFAGALYYSPRNVALTVIGDLAGVLIVYITAFDGDFGASFAVWPRTLDGGGRVWFSIKIRKYQPKYKYSENLFKDFNTLTTYHLEIVEQNGTVIKNFSYSLPDKEGTYTLEIPGPILYRTGKYPKEDSL